MGRPHLSTKITLKPKMLSLINCVCKESSGAAFKSKESFAEFLARKAVQYGVASILGSADVALLCQKLCGYRQEKTGDGLINYASRCGNLQLIEFLYQEIDTLTGLSIKSKLFSSTNNDGKNGLHEVSLQCYLTAASSRTISPLVILTTGLSEWSL